MRPVKALDVLNHLRRCPTSGPARGTRPVWTMLGAVDQAPPPDLGQRDISVDDEARSFAWTFEAVRQSCGRGSPLAYVPTTRRARPDRQPLRVLRPSLQHRPVSQSVNNPTLCGTLEHLHSSLPRGSIALLPN